MNQLVLKKKNELMKKKKGFTLVELIIVIAVIAVLAAIAIPKFGAVKKDANLRADQANAKIIATAVATAVANGDTNPATDTVYVKYIDGAKVPTPKDSSKSSFFVSYTEDSTTGTTTTLGKGVVVKYDSDTGTQLYPPLS
ncbi:prepilin-type N-terminal cleavage/methylation domain-containing protein [Clostridium butyricum]|uniref:prepilin-type N-terminal cleavage/methylation domain-containing protein n=1 Tax=Clostridium butyricum TaxID=1492 RepID=UPI0024BB4E62|nr:prepilin-type N-terminal cleavage/methylation domain-containing protein [Clostridium butyricum]